MLEPLIYCYRLDNDYILYRKVKTAFGVSLWGLTAFSILKTGRSGTIHASNMTAK